MAIYTAAGRSVVVAVALVYGIGDGFDCSGGNGASTRFTFPMATRESSQIQYRLSGGWNIQITVRRAARLSCGCTS